MTKTLNLFVLFIVLFSMLSCDNKNGNEITAFYFCGKIESYRQLDCATLDSSCKMSDYDDTIFIDSNMAEKFKRGVKEAKIQECNNSLTPIIYVNFGSMELCLSETDNFCWVKQSNGNYNTSVLSNKIAYLLKWKSKYYNHLSSVDLKFDKGIQQFGVPSDYKCEKPNKMMKRKETYKVLIKII